MTCSLSQFVCSLGLRLNRALTQSHHRHPASLTTTHILPLTGSTGQASQLVREGVGYKSPNLVSNLPLTPHTLLLCSSTWQQVDDASNLSQLRSHPNNSISQHEQAQLQAYSCRQSEQHFCAGRASTQDLRVCPSISCSLCRLFPSLSLAMCGTCHYGDSFTCTSGPCALAVYVSTLHIPRFSPSPPPHNL